jgi:integrase
MAMLRLTASPAGTTVPSSLLELTGGLDDVNLRWEDLDVAGRQLVVTQQVVQLGWDTEIGSSKTDSGTRVVPLDAGTLAVLQAWRHVQQAEAQAWGEGLATHRTRVHPRGRQRLTPRVLVSCP